MLFFVCAVYMYSGLGQPCPPPYPPGKGWGTCSILRCIPPCHDLYMGGGHLYRSTVNMKCHKNKTAPSPRERGVIISGKTQPQALRTGAQRKGVLACPPLTRLPQELRPHNLGLVPQQPQMVVMLLLLLIMTLLHLLQMNFIEPPTPA